MSTERVLINGSPALIVSIDGQIDNAVSFRFDEGKITGLYIVRNPDKLSRLAQEVSLDR